MRDGEDARGGSGPANPCRLSVFLALEAPVGAVLRRGPTDWAHLSLWDREQDRVEHGQWFRGRIYGRRCDLSPDGRLFVYFAARHGKLDGPYGEAWTALSRPPWLSALGVWENVGSWYGGGAFESNRDLRLDATCTLEVHPDFQSPPLRIRHIGGDTAPWEARFLAHGWALQERGFHPRTHQRVGEREVWSKPHPSGDVTLFQQVEDWDPSRYGDPYWSTYWLETGEDLLPLDGVEWADFDTAQPDGHGPRLVYSRRGAIRTAQWSDVDTTERTIHDFNPLEPDPHPAPAWARQWPQ